MKTADDRDRETRYKRLRRPHPSGYTVHKLYGLALFVVLTGDGKYVTPAPVTMEGAEELVLGR